MVRSRKARLHQGDLASRGTLPRGVPPQQYARSMHTFQHASPGLAVGDLEPVTFQFEGTRLVCIGEVRCHAALDMMSHNMLFCVYGVGAKISEISGESGEGML